MPREALASTPVTRELAHEPDHRWFAWFQARASARSEMLGGAAHRRRLLAGLAGEVLEVGAGSGITFAHYPPSVRHVLAIEPEPNLRALATRTALDAPVEIDVVAAVADRLPVRDASLDAVVAAGVLCSVQDPSAALREFARVLRADGVLCVYEHVGAHGAAASAGQRMVDLVWPRLFGGCRTTRDTERTIGDAGFRFVWIERFAFRPTISAVPVAPRILGVAEKS
jgi:ubiquinone/menaquinone biosynthesis C-methylase UbiE